MPPPAAMLVGGCAAMTSCAGAAGTTLKAPEVAEPRPPAVASRE